MMRESLQIKHFIEDAEPILVPSFYGPGISGVKWYEAEKKACLKFDEWNRPNFKIFNIQIEHHRSEQNIWIDLAVIYSIMEEGTVNG